LSPDKLTWAEKRKTMGALLSLPSKEGSQVPFSSRMPALFTLRDSREERMSGQARAYD